MDILTFYVIGGLTYLFALMVKRKLLSTYAKWEHVQTVSGLRGEQVARKILDNNQLQFVSVRSQPGELTDHYDPRSKSISLSAQNFMSESVSATAIAAHECGHAIQDANGYLPMKLRAAAIPAANAAARFGIPAAILGGVLGINIMVQVGMLAYAGSILVMFLVLPVEFNASKVALQQLEQLDLTAPGGQDGAKQVLRAAAMTYVAGVASSAGYVVFIAISAGSSMFGKTKGPHVK
jgi:Zn-dependent membrane protease YugP